EMIFLEGNHLVGRRCRFAADMHTDRVMDVINRVSRFDGARAQIVIFAEQKNIFVEAAKLVEYRLSKQQRRAHPHRNGAIRRRWRAEPDAIIDKTIGAVKLNLALWI